MDFTPYWDHFGALAVIFLASLLVLNHFVFKPTLLILKERDNRMNGMTKEAKYFAEQYEEKLNAYNQLMTEARQLARQKREEILKVAEQEQREILGEARKIAEASVSQAKTEISIQTKEAKLQLRKNAELISGNIVEKVLKRKVA